MLPFLVHADRPTKRQYPVVYSEFKIVIQLHLLHDVFQGHVTEVKGIGRRRTQLLDDLRKRRRYWELNEETDCPKRLKR